MPFIVVDLDGCLIDDINAAFDRLFRKPLDGPSKFAERVFKEAIFAAMTKLPKHSASKSIRMRIDFDSNVVDAIKTAFEKGYKSIVRTANPNFKESDSIDAVKAQLRSEFNVDVDFSYSENRLKHGMYNGEKPALLIEDNPEVAINAARNGIDVLLMLKDYNGFLGRVLAKLNHKIQVVGPDELGKNVRARLKDLKSIS